VGFGEALQAGVEQRLRGLGREALACVSACAYCERTDA
jgi:hypothetical protein